MGHYYSNSTDGKSITHIHLCDIYEYNGFCFEWHDYLGLTRYRKSDMTATYTLGPKFLAAFEEWFDLSETKREKFLIHG